MLLRSSAAVLVPALLHAGMLGRAQYSMLEQVSQAELLSDLLHRK
jgi:hypothetical protein